MKKITSLALPAAISVYVLLLVSSCQQEPQPEIIRYEATFYFGGNTYGDETAGGRALIYKDSTALYDLGENAFVQGLVSGKDGIYACGGFQNPADYRLDTPVIWKDGIPMDIDFGSDYAFLTDMAGDDDGWVCCGSAGVEERHGIVIRNGEVLYRSEEPCEFCAIACGLSGDFYVGAVFESGPKLLRIDASTGKVSFTEDIKGIKAGDMYDITDICVGIHDIAVSLYGLDDKMNMHGYCWIRDRRVYDLGDNTEAASVSFFNGYCFIGGATYDKSGSKAVQWVNGYVEDFSSGCKGDSYVREMLNFGNQYLFQLVQYEGGLQICCNGALFKDIKTPERFNATCLDGVFKRVP